MSAYFYRTAKAQGTLITTRSAADAKALIARRFACEVEEFRALMLGGGGEKLQTDVPARRAAGRFSRMQN